MATDQVLCRLTRSEAEILGMAAAAAGGWIAVDPACTAAVDVAIGPGRAEYLALLPITWHEAGVRPVEREQASLIADKLRRVAQIVGAPEAIEIARRIDEHFAAAP